MPFEESDRSSQMKLRRAVYGLPTIGKTILQDFKKALLEHPGRAIKGSPANFKGQSLEMENTPTLPPDGIATSCRGY